MLVAPASSEEEIVIWWQYFRFNEFIERKEDKRTKSVVFYPHIHKILRII